MPQTDLVIARVIEHLDQEARKRFDLFLVKCEKKSQINAGIKFYAFENDFIGIAAIEAMRVSIRKGKLYFLLELKGGMVWEHSRLTVKAELPDTVINAMRGQMLSQIIDHPIFEDVKISSARKINDVANDNETVFVIEPKKTAMIEIDSIKSSGKSSPIKIEDVFTSLNVEEVCKVAANIIEALSPDNRQTLIKRLAQGKTPVDISDLLPWPSKDINSVRLYIQDNILKMKADVFNGRFYTGYLSIHGGYQSHDRVMRSGVFLPYRSFFSAKKIIKPRKLTIPVDKLYSLIELKYDKAA